MKKRLHLIITIIFLLIVSPFLVGCFGDDDNRLPAPEIKLHEESKCITWDTHSKCSSYDIYINKEYKDSVDNAVDDKHSRMFDFSEYLVANGEYQIYIIAKSNIKGLDDSLASNIVKYTYTSINHSDESVDDLITSDYQISCTLNGGNVSFTPIENVEVDTYILYLYSNSTGLNKYDLDTCNTSLYSTKYNIHNLPKESLDIYAVRIGYKIEGVEYVSSNIMYYNPDKYSTYTDNIYIFDGLINDHYIESIQELNNIIYYTFITRTQSFDVALSDEFLKLVDSSDNTFGMSINSKFDKLIESGFKSFYETMSYSSANPGGFIKKISNNEYNIKVNYNNIKECDKTILPATYLEQGDVVTYLDTHDFVTISEEYGKDWNDFASDKHFLYTNVSTSEELYWAVENDITPKFDYVNSEKSSAYKIYKKAKNVIRNNISQDMTDYEKALVLFEWICENSVYDHTKYTQANNYDATIENYPMKLPCYYLEGVFDTGYAVCDGFSKAYSLLCNMIGIDCMRIVGDAGTKQNNGGHAWNKVLLDIDTTDSLPASYYLVDITWTEFQSLSDDLEIISHEYFLISDEMVKDTHFDFKDRPKFANYKTGDAYYYYLAQKFEHNENTYDFVVDNDEDFVALCEYILVNNLDTFEFVIDVDYMIEYYNSLEENKDSPYLTSKEVENKYFSTGYGLLYHNVDTLVEYVMVVDKFGNPILDKFGHYQYNVEYHYYYTLKNTFVQKMRELKIPAQYIMLNYDNDGTVYNSQGDKGVVYVFQQNLMIDSLVEEDSADGKKYNEPENLSEFIIANNVTGKFNMFISKEILSSRTENSLIGKAFGLFSNYFTNTNLEIDFELTGVEDNESYMFIFTIREK